MKKTFIFGGILMIAGVVLSLSALAKGNFDFDSIKLNDQYEKKEAHYSEVNSISYRGDADDFSIVYDATLTDLQIVYNEGTRMTYTINNENNGIQIVQNYDSKKWYESTSWFENSSLDFIIKTPYHLDSLNIDLHAGEVDIEGLNINNTDVTLNAGEINIKNCHLTTANLKNNTGEIQTENTEVVDATVEVNVGSIDYKGTITHSFDGKVNVGAIDLELNQPENQLPQGSITLKSDVGDTSIHYEN